jgi:hypothetical protein
MKGNSTMKKILVFLPLFLIVAQACDVTVSVAPPTDLIPLPTNIMISVSGAATEIPASATPIPATLAPTQIPAPATSAPTTFVPNEQPTSSAGLVTTYGQLTIVVPPGVANGASGREMPRIAGEDAAWWQKTPNHWQINLGDYYILQGKSLQPQIYVYPALDYAVLVPAAFESIHRLDNILFGPAGPNLNEPLPTVPFFNAQQVFTSNAQVISFQNGQGVRFLTEYAQYPASANNHDLFYNFQGLSSDGDYYIVAIFPVTVPVLAETSDAGAVLPAGGVPYPYFSDPNADMQSYYTAITGLLNATSPQAFAPRLDQLDALVQSMRIAP